MSKVQLHPSSLLLSVKAYRFTKIQVVLPSDRLFLQLVGIVVDAWVRVSLVGIELLAIEARVVIASVETT